MAYNEDANQSGTTGFGTTGSGSTGGSTGFGSTGAGSTGSSTGFGASTGSSGMTDDAGTRAGSYDRKFTGETDGGMRERLTDKVSEGREALNERLDDGRERLSGAVETGRERVVEAVGSNKNRVADQMERLSDRLEERARGMEEAGGMQRRASQAALRATGALDSGANYIRSHEPNEMRDDLETAIRERPLLSVGVAVGAGFLLARLLRD